MLDVKFSRGEVFDGTGAAPFTADVCIRNGRIACIGDLSDLEAHTHLDLNGLALSPGFVDLHTHSDFTLLVNGRAESQVHQGVTTEVIGQCGHSCAPVAHKGHAKHGAIGYSEDSSVSMDWQSFGDYLERLGISLLFGALRLLREGFSISLPERLPRRNLYQILVFDGARPQHCTDPATPRDNRATPKDSRGKNRPNKSPCPPPHPQNS